MELRFELRLEQERLLCHWERAEIALWPASSGMG
jgi:hypothetical protein